MAEQIRAVEHTQSPNTMASPATSPAAATDLRSHGEDGTIGRINEDAALLEQFEQTGKSFDYSRSIVSAPQSVPEEQIVSYLSTIQRGGLVQSFGCVIVIHEPTFQIIGYSENCYEMMGFGASSTQGYKDLTGRDARSLFTDSSCACLLKGVASRELSVVNPLLLYSRTTKKPFYALIHRIDVGLVIDLEPTSSSDPAQLLAEALQYQKLVFRAISRLQALPRGDISLLCDSVVSEVHKLTGYDRVMSYRFHEDDHGEVVSEIRRPDLEPYVGLHYPAPDIPLAARFLFMQNGTRIICDCRARPVKMTQSNELNQPLCLVNSSLRSPHECHMQYMVNMGSIASLVMAVVVSDGRDLSRLWGLMVCHHTSPRHVPYTLRYACQVLMQAFSQQLYTELQLRLHALEKKILKTQTLLFDMLRRDGPFGVIHQFPNLMHLIMCDGAALFYGGKCMCLGVAPTESQVIDIVNWVLEKHGDSNELSTDSLAASGYPDAGVLGNAVCGMAVGKISSKDYLLWFRSAEEVKWAGAQQHPDLKEDGERMHPRTSFKAFLEAVKRRSRPWEIPEIKAIHSLRLLMEEACREDNNNRSKAVVSFWKQSDGQPEGIEELDWMTYEMFRLIEAARAPIFRVDSGGRISSWNSKIAELTGLQAHDAMGKLLVDEVLHEDSRVVVENHISRALQGEEYKDVELKLRNFGTLSSTSSLDVYIKTSACTSRDHLNNITSVCFIGQDVTHEKALIDKFNRLQADYKSIIQSVNPLIPPIFASDENARCSEWNPSMENLTGWKKCEVINKLLPGEVFGELCRVKGQDFLTKFMIQLYRGISTQEIEKSQFGFYDRRGKYVDVVFTTSRRIGEDGKVIGCFCFMQNVVSNPEEIVRSDQ